MMSLKSFLKSVAAKPLLFVLLILPFVYLIWLGWNDALGSDPAKFVVEYFAVVAFNMLLVTVSITPLKKMTGQAGFVRFKRMMGLYVYFYVVLHVASYLVFMADWPQLIDDLLKKPYIAPGFAAFLLLSGLAITSNKVSMRKLAKNWVALHKTVYLAVILVFVHFMWQERADYRASFIYFIVILMLFVSRFGLTLFRRFAGRM